MKQSHLILCIFLVALLAGCGLKRNLSMPKTPATSQAQGQTAANPVPATSTVTTSNTPAASTEVPPSTSFMIAPQVNQPLAPAILSAPTR